MTFAEDRRRYALYYLRTDERAELDDLVEYVADRETEPSHGPDVGTRLTVRLSLHHNHLPKLDDAGIIEYDHRDRTAYIRHLTDFQEQILEDCATYEASDRVD